jgi:hypothetical protein
MKIRIGNVTLSPEAAKARAKATAPSASQVDRDKAMKGFLSRYERAELALAQIRQENEDLFNKIEFHEAEKAECLASIRRLAFTKEGPPPGVKLQGKTAYPAKTQHFGVKVVYKKHSDYYDPELLPELVLRTPGVVKEVDSAAIDALLTASKGTIQGSLLTRAVAAAKKEGEWMTPSVSIERLKASGEPQEGF